MLKILINYINKTFIILYYTQRFPTILYWFLKAISQSDPTPFDTQTATISVKQRDVRFGSNVGHIGPKWEKSVTFSNQISVHFGSVGQNVLKSDMEKVPNLSQYGLIWPTFDPNLTSLCPWPMFMFVYLFFWLTCLASLVVIWLKTSVLVLHQAFVT